MRVAFFAYSGTAQERCLRLMGKKLMVSLAMEGKLQGEGLQSMDDDADLLTAMARELVTQQGVGEEAAAVWRALQQQREEVAPKTAVQMPEVLPLDEPLIAAEERESTPWIPIVRAEQLSLF